MNVAGTYVWPAGNSLPGDVIANATYSWADKVNHDLQLAPWMEADSYGVLNLSLGIDVAGDIYQTVEVFANNLLDDSYDSGLLDSSLAARTEATSRLIPRDYSRHYGVRLKIGM